MPDSPSLVYLWRQGAADERQRASRARQLALRVRVRVRRRLIARGGSELAAGRMLYSMYTHESI